MICAKFEDMGHDVPNRVWIVMMDDTGSTDWAGIVSYSVTEPELGNDLCTSSITSDKALMQTTCKLRGVKSAEKVVRKWNRDRTKRG